VLYICCPSQKSHELLEQAQKRCGGQGPGCPHPIGRLMSHMNRRCGTVWTEEGPSLQEKCSWGPQEGLGFRETCVPQMGWKEW
jgi:hypothetical protein